MKKRFSASVLLCNFLAFSLIELMISLITISCITAAFAPVITKKLNSNDTILRYIDSKITEYESEEYTTAGEYEFTVPQDVEKLKVTLISGGEGGEAGNSSLETVKFTQVGENTFNIPVELRNKYAVVDICGGGGAGGGVASAICWKQVLNYFGAAGGGSGGVYANKVVLFSNKFTTQVFVGGGGGKSFLPIGGSYPFGAFNTSVGWDSCFQDNPIPFECLDSIRAANAEDGSGGAGGVVTGAASGSRFGGSGGFLNGGSGAAYFGDCGLTGGGGGGGGASRLGVSGDSHYLYVGGGGGGGGEGANLIFNDSVGLISRSGGAGGGGGGISVGGKGGDSYEMNLGCIAQGGGGGKPGGNDGGNSGCDEGVTYNGYRVGNSGAGGASPLAKYPDKCRGGDGEGINQTYNDRTYNNTYWGHGNPNQAGSDGIVTITYLKALNGGRGGNSGRKISKTFSAAAGEKYKIIVGGGSSGAISQYINSSGATETSVSAGVINHSYIYKDGAKIAGTDDESATFKSSAASSTFAGKKGANIAGVITCEAGAGGTSDNLNGEDATGYGGCGGGGGYGGGNGGKGSDGYVIIQWEKK